MWEYNEYEDFVPYYDSFVKKWRVSVQYLGLWSFRTKEEAEKAIPKIKEYRLKRLAWVEEQNRKYYASLEEKANRYKKELQHIKNREKRIACRKMSSLSPKEQADVRKMLADGVDDLVVMEKYNLNCITIAQIKFHLKKENKLCIKNTKQ